MQLIRNTQGKTRVEIAQEQQRRKLLAMIHIAKKDLGLTAEQYEAILQGFKVESAKDLSLIQLDNCVKYLKHIGWNYQPKPKRVGPDPKRVKALQERAKDLAGKLVNGEQRLQGLVRSVCRTTFLEWCTDTVKLERLLKVLGELIKAEV
jgi:phage gp16-like protein